ncbi:hypothetical protein HCJ39_07235 [Listeria rocourtiae]|uniref:hypothetical protein n=1 Tax=Listeria rocourtiae TaxID=647910 RepID=UPI001623568A|nr:hypothetical protein [Listeria rocourtiae]MBC1604504.1 hypothetical protein [Listeria rocourtiae]
MQEKELYEPVRNWLYQHVGCEAVYAEVWDVDVLGTHGACNVLVELKTSLSFKLLDQAIDRVKGAYKRRNGAFITSRFIRLFK